MTFSFITLILFDGCWNGIDRSKILLQQSTGFPVWDSAVLASADMQSCMGSESQKPNGFSVYESQVCGTEFHGDGKSHDWLG